MFDGLARKFFYTTLASGFLAYGSGFTAGPKKLNAFVKEVQQFRKASREMMTSSSIGEKPRLNAPTLNGMKAPELKESGEVKLKENGKDYVLIEGRYHEYRADHVYNVNGKRVFYFNDRASTKAPVGEKLAQAESAADAAALAGRNVQNESMGSAGQTENGAAATDDDSVLSPTEALKKIQQLQRQMKERDSFLNDMGDEFKQK